MKKQEVLLKVSMESCSAQGVKCKRQTDGQGCDGVKKPKRG